MKFEGETLSIGGFEIGGTIIVEGRTTDASFSHEFGTEEVYETELSGDFVPNDDSLKLSEQLTQRAVADWVDSHEAQIFKRQSQLNQ